MPVLDQNHVTPCSEVELFFFKYSLQVQIGCAGLVGFIMYVWCTLRYRGPSYKKENRIDKNVAVVTGCNTGRGKEIALELARRGCRVYMACQNFQKCEKTRRQIIKMSGNTNVFSSRLDLASLQSVRDFVNQFKRQEACLDILVNNATHKGTQRHITADGYEIHFAVNHLGHFLLTNLLLAYLRKSTQGRIVVLTMRCYTRAKFQRNDLHGANKYHPYAAYCQSKLANVLFTRKLAKLLRNTKVTVNCANSGSVYAGPSLKSRIMYWFLRSMFYSSRAAAQTAIFLALDPDLYSTSGHYYESMAEVKMNAEALNDRSANWLWSQSEKMAGLRPTRI